MKVKEWEGELTAGFHFWCPGCESMHTVQTVGPSPWQWDEKTLTLSPSVLVNRDRSNPNHPRCHLFLKQGMLQFLGDCSHDMAGQTVALPDIPEDWR